ncbi:MAG: hypothetical protein VX619_09875 [bacterium]|nr:hypothetical protein [bacterium]
MKPREIQKIMNEAIALVQQNEKEKAREKFEELLDKANNDSVVLFNAGIFYSQLGEHLEASDYLHQSLEKDPNNKETLRRTILEDFHIGGGEVLDSDFMAFDPQYLVKAQGLIENALEKDSSAEDLKELMERVETTIMQNRLAFKFCEGDLNYCRRSVSRKKELTNLDERVMGFLNLLDSGEYDYVQGKFGVTLRDDLPKDRGPGFLDQIRNYLLGK